MDVIVIGGGTAGIKVATGVAKLGLKVTLIERKKLGGNLSHPDCIPTKAFIHAANLYKDIQKAADFGINAITSELELNTYLDKVVKDTQKQYSKAKLTKQGVNLIIGSPKFINKNTITVNDTIIEAKYFVIATGSTPLIPRVAGLRNTPHFTTDTILELKQIPKKLAILGASSSGLELAQAFARFGTHVTVISEQKIILPFLTSEIRKSVKANLESEGISFILNSKLKECIKQQQQKVIIFTHKQEEFMLTADEILIASERRANLDGLNLDSINLKYDTMGISVDSKLRTNLKRIYALGDVIHSPAKYSHTTDHQASIVISNLAFKWPKHIEYQHVPHIIQLDPMIAQIGVVNPETDHTVISFDLAKLIPASHLPIQGKIKLILKDHTIKGATIMSPNANEIISELTLAIRKKLTLADLATTIHPHSTACEIIRYAAKSYYANKVYSNSTNKLIKFIHSLIS